MIPGSTAKSHDAKETSKDCLGCRDSGLGLMFFLIMIWGGLGDGFMVWGAGFRG